MEREFSVVRRWAALAAACILTFCVLAFGTVLSRGSEASFPPSLYRSEMKRELPQKERWQLDFELANELSMHVNSRRFDAPGSFEKRAKWVEEMATWYPIADLLQQILDIRRFKTWNNEFAYNQLVDMGKRGDVAARCLAWMFYRYHAADITRKWKYSYEDVARLAIEVKDSGHPACAGMEGGFYMHGLMGYPEDRKKAKPYFIDSAITGFYGSQYYLAITHLIKGPAISPKEAELQLCWRRVASTQSPAAHFNETCAAYRRGAVFGVDGKEYAVTEDIKELANKWCTEDQHMKVTAQSCANLERQYGEK